MCSKSLIFLREYYQKKNLLIEEYIDQSSCKTKQIHRVNKTILLTSMMKREKLEVVQVGQKIKVLMLARDQAFQEHQKDQRKAVYKEID